MKNIKVIIISFLAFALLIGVILFAIYTPRNFRIGEHESNGPEYRNVPWSEAVMILNSGRVEQVTQLHSLEVFMRLEDGSRIKTIEPQIDDIFEEIRICGKPCDDIILATE